MRLPTLYGRASTGKIKVWKVEVTKLGAVAWYEVSHGYLDGEIQVNGKEISKGKNIGKANETTPYEQACSEARSAWKKQLDRGYVEDKDNIPYAGDVEFFLPMLAHRFDKRGNKIVWPAYGQPKLDGCRCIARKKDGKVTLWSRQAKLFEVPKVLIAELEEILEDDECVDGEIYVHEWLGKKSFEGKTGFQRIVSALKAWNEDTDHLQYHIYDSPDDKVGFSERFVDGIAKTIGDRLNDEHHVKIVETKLLDSQDDALKMFSEVMGERYEGLMVRNIDGKYKYKNRSTDLQKIKEFDDDEFVIIGGNEASGKDAGTVVFVCKSKGGTPARDGTVGVDGEVFDVRPVGTFQVRKEYWDNLDNYIGKELTVAFQGYTNRGVPRFPTGQHVRPDWDK